MARTHGIRVSDGVDPVLRRAPLQNYGICAITPAMPCHIHTLHTLPPRLRHMPHIHTYTYIHILPLPLLLRCCHRKIHIRSSSSSLVRMQLRQRPLHESLLLSFPPPFSCFSFCLLLPHCLSGEHWWFPRHSSACACALPARFLSPAKRPVGGQQRFKCRNK